MGKILFDENPLVIDTTLAKALGLNEAIVLQQVHYWLEINKRKNLNFVDGRYWTYNSIKKWHEENFSFWVEKTVKRTFSNLVDKGVLVTGNYNKQKMDRTLWYSIDYEKLNDIINDFKGENALGQKVPMEKDKKSQCKGTKSPNGEGQIDPMQEDKKSPPIPETYTETSTKTSTEISSSSSSDEKNDDADNGVLNKNDFLNSDYQEVLECFNNNIHPVTPMEAQKLSSWLSDTSKEIVIYAVEAAVMYGARNMRYIDSVLNGLLNAGVKTKEGLDAYIRDFQDKKNKRSYGKTEAMSNPVKKDEYGYDMGKIREMLLGNGNSVREDSAENVIEEDKDEQSIFDW